MIVKINTGKSFKGAALYQLHDKREKGEAVRLTTDRVAWTHSLNLMEDAPEHAVREMIQTARDQAMLKRQSGNRADGRPIKDTVMTVALAWSPEEKPTQAQMVEGAQSFLKHMGWDQLQALLVAHNDMPHPHVHLIVNRVNPDTGMTQDVSWMKHRSGQWALGYEREQGKVLCPAREEKYGNEANLNRREWTTWQRMSSDAMVADRDQHQAALQSGEWDALKDAQKNEREAFWKESGQLRKALRGEVAREVKGEFAGDWKAYDAVRADKDKAARDYDAEARRMVRHLGRQHQARGAAVASLRSVQDVKQRQGQYHQDQRDELKAMREEIAERQHARLEELAKERLEALGKDRAQAYDRLKTSHREERAGLRDDQAAGIRRPDLLERQHESAKRLDALQPDKAHSERDAWRAAARQQSTKDHLRADTRGMSPRAPDTGRLSEGEAAAERPTAEGAREVTEKEARRQAAEERRPKTDRDAWKAATRANFRDRSRGEDDGGGGRDR